LEEKGAGERAKATLDSFVAQVPKQQP